MEKVGFKLPNIQTKKLKAQKNFQDFLRSLPHSSSLAFQPSNIPQFCDKSAIKNNLPIVVWTISGSYSLQLKNIWLQKIVINKETMTKISKTSYFYFWNWLYNAITRIETKGTFWLISSKSPKYAISSNTKWPNVFTMFTIFAILLCCRWNFKHVWYI